MKPYEVVYLCAEPFRLPFYRMVRKRLRRLARDCQGRPEILDVGGRTSPYTVGIPARITITDVPRESAIQRKLNLGITQDIIRRTLRRRSNVVKIVEDDMTRSALPSQFFDCVVASEVLEHVKEDTLFVRQVARVLKPGQVFLMTTPNADHPGRQGHIPPGNERFYTKDHLTALLSSCFESVEIEYAILVGFYHSLGMKRFSIRHPCRTLLSMTANLINSIKSARSEVRHMAQGTRHLVATARTRD